MHRTDIIAIAGRIGSGKTTAAEHMRVMGLKAAYVRSRDLLAARHGEPRDLSRAGLQDVGMLADMETPNWLVDQMPSAQTVVLDCVRNASQLESLRRFGGRLRLLYCVCPGDVRRRRCDERGDSPYLDAHANESGVEKLVYFANDVIDTSLDVAAQVMPVVFAPLVDALIGGQYGSEGKGHIASYLAPNYDVLVRSGGPNAGHQVNYSNTRFAGGAGSHITFYQIPSGALHNPDAMLVLARGSVLNLVKLKLEVEALACLLGRQPRLKVDERAVVISHANIRAEEALRHRIGSTGQGVGAAAADRVMRCAPTVRQTVKSSSDYKWLEPYLADTVEFLSGSHRIFIEGTQGFGLSLYHGDYPFTTSRDTGVAALLSETGISPDRLNRVYMVCRTFPIRVQSPDGGTSGPMPNEIGWEQISERTGIPVATLMERERTSTTKRLRRVSKPSFPELRRAAGMNAVTDVVMTFADYISERTAEASSVADMCDDGKDFLAHLERATQTKVSLISCGFDNNKIIDRRFA